DRRIPLQHLIRFMKAHGIPLKSIETGQTRTLIADPETELTDLLREALRTAGDYAVRVADSTFEAGALTHDFRPHVLLVSLDLPGMDGRSLVRYFAGRGELAGTRIIGTSPAL